MGTITIDPSKTEVATFHGLLLGAVTPRPIAFASTVDGKGNVNLSPYSFFNAFSANPPILVFSPARRVRDNTTKHTLENIREVPEVVINMVNFAMAEQTSLASTEYEKGVNEFVKSGFTEASSEKVRPPRVAESPVAFECKVDDVISLGDQGGAGNLVIARVLLAHVDEHILDSHGRIDPVKLNPIGRLGGDWYTRVMQESLFKIAKPIRNKGIGVDQIPEGIRLSRILTGNHLGKLGNVEILPSQEEVKAFMNDEEFLRIYGGNYIDRQDKRDAIHAFARSLLDMGRVEDAWKALLVSESG